MLVWTLLLAATPPAPVAVFPIKGTDVESFDAKSLEKFSDLLDTVVSSHGIPTVPRSDLRAAIRKEQVDTFKECYDEACQIELGKAVAAQKSLISSWSRFGDSCVLAVRMSNLKTELTEFSTTQEVACTEVGLKQAINNAGLELAAFMDEDPTGFGSATISAFSPRASGKSIVNKATDRRGYLYVKSTPAGAQVFINGEERGVTPYQVELMEGRYVVILTAGALYKPFRKEVKLSPNGVKLDARLDPNFGVLRVESKPAGAEIIIDGVATGQVTPHTFPPKKAGAVAVGLKHPHFFSAEKKVRLGSGKERTVRFTLRPNHGSLAVASEPSDVPIFVDGVDTGLKTPALIERVGDGLHTVEVKSSKFKAPAQQITIRRNVRSATTFVLEERRGRLRVAAVLTEREGRRPIEADVFVDGKQVSGKTPLGVDVLVGAHEIELRIEGARPFVRSVMVAEDQTTRVEGELTFLTARELEDLRADEDRARRQIVATHALELRANRRSTARWTALAGGIVAIAGGVLLGVAVGAASSADDATTVADIDSAHRLGRGTQIGGWVGVSVGSAALISSLVLFLTHLEGSASIDEGGEGW